MARRPLTNAEHAEWLRVQAEDASWDGDWDRAEALDARADYLDDAGDEY